MLTVGLKRQSPDDFWVFGRIKQTRCKILMNELQGCWLAESIPSGKSQSGCFLSLSSLCAKLSQPALGCHFIITVSIFSFNSQKETSEVYLPEAQSLAKGSAIHTSS